MDRIEHEGTKRHGRFLGNTAHRLGDQNPSDQDADNQQGGFLQPRTRLESARPPSVDQGCSGYQRGSTPGISPGRKPC